MNAIHLALLVCGPIIIAAALSGCAQPTVAQATDCRGAVEPCGIVVIDRTHAMSNLPVTVPVSALPGMP
jgi:hypothetical protein